MQTTDELLTTREVAQLLSVSSQRVRQLVRDRVDFPQPVYESQTKRGVGMRCWRRQDVERWAASADRSHGRRWPE